MKYSYLFYKIQTQTHTHKHMFEEKENMMMYYMCDLYTLSFFFFMQYNL